MVGLVLDLALEEEEVEVMDEGEEAEEEEVGIISRVNRLWNALRLLWR